MTKRCDSARAMALMVALVMLLAGAYAAQARENLSPADLVPYDQGEAVAGEMIVKFKPGVAPAAIDAINRAHGTAAFYRSPFAGFMRLRLPSGRGVGQMVAAYRRNPNVEYAEPNFVRRALMLPNDSYYSYQWHLDDSAWPAGPNPYGGVNGGGINLEPAWDISTGAGVVVAVIDTGIAYEDYSQRIRGRFRQYYYQAPDLAQTTFVPGYDFINNDTHPNDDQGHGTHVAGTIAQSTNNSLGVAGVAFGASLMPVKVLDALGFGTDAEVADGIWFAADNGAQVLNLSLGDTAPSTTLENAVAHAYEVGATVVCAAGNEGYFFNRPLYPAAYDAYCIAVSATRYDEMRAPYSNYGSYVDIAAPGGDLNVDQNGDGYGDGVLQNTFNVNTGDTSDFAYWFLQGTSMASPHVAGVAALLIANGVSSPDQVRAALQSTAEDKGAPGWDPEYGWGLVDAYAALTYTPAPTHDVAVTNLDVPGSAAQGDLVSIYVTVANPGDYAETFDVIVTDVTDSVLIGDETVTGLGAGATQLVSFTWDTTSASSGDHTLIAEATAVAGETNLANNSRTTTVGIVPPGQTMHVADITMSLKFAGKNTSARATVTVADAGGNPVAGATVSGHWSGATSDSDVGLTDAAGQVTLESNKVKAATSGTTFTFTVDTVALAGRTYDPASNVETSDSITVP
ncbi:MAG: S8 family serine peptidase [Armatimonadota bacterium]|nr:MAG: S8 family serine peptidase [Armatimonadota bacterium]